MLSNLFYIYVVVVSRVYDLQRPIIILLRSTYAHVVIKMRLFVYVLVSNECVCEYLFIALDMSIYESLYKVIIAIITLVYIRVRACIKGQYRKFLRLN